MRPRALVSIHDVMPGNLDRVDELIELCRAAGVRRLTLLVVPGLDWGPTELARLQQFVAAGYQLAGHGWVHRCTRYGGWSHRLHSWLISRDVAEHLQCDEAGRIALVRRCVAWFAEHDLPHPALYVPPAWALGSIARRRLSGLPVPLIETTAGLLETNSGRRWRLPLVGFEADTSLRKWLLRCWNATQPALGCWSGRPLRISLHPRDHRLLLAEALRELLGRGWECLDYRACWSGSSSDPTVG
jgi:hypothetical protein